MREIRFTVQDIGTDPGIPDAVLDVNDPIYQIAGGEKPRRDFSQLPAWQKDDPTNEKAKIMREQNIRPGTPAWFQLWFGK